MRGFCSFVLFLVTLLVCSPIVFSAEIKINGFVNDYANIINDSERTTIESVLSNIYNSGAAQFSIVTIKSLEGKAIDAYTLELAQDVLGDKEKNNGLLLLISVEDKKYRFEVGRGLESTLNDAKIGRVGRDYLIPSFREGKYSEGILKASLAIQNTISGNTSSKYYINNSKVPSFNQSWIVFLLFCIFFILIPSISYASKANKGKNKYFDAAAGAIILFGGGRGGSGGSGFGGFGGGGFGGGGAGGSW